MLTTKRPKRSSEPNVHVHKQYIILGMVLHVHVYESQHIIPIYTCIRKDIHVPFTG